MNEQLTTRLTILKQEFAKGQMRLQEIERQEVTLREALLRLSGAIEVLEEIVGSQMPMGQMPAGPTEPRTGETIPTSLSRLSG